MLIDFVRGIAETTNFFPKQIQNGAEWFVSDPKKNQ